jgi:phospholipid/cholesterol/gamma-HCH transport system permease protein
MANVSAAAVLRARYPRTVANLNRYGGAAGRGLDQVGHLASFARISVIEIGWALRRYPTEILRLIAQVGMGTGAMAVVGGRPRSWVS